MLLCLNTKGVLMELAPRYSTDDFMLAYKNHYSSWVIPSFLHSDRGTQLVAVQKELSIGPLRYHRNSIGSSALKKK